MSDLSDPNQDFESISRTLQHEYDLVLRYRVAGRSTKQALFMAMNKGHTPNLESMMNNSVGEPVEILERICDRIESYGG